MDSKALARFNSKHTPEPNTGCWLWIGTIDRDGYGFFRIDRRLQLRAHRLSWEMHRGTIPDGLHVLHRCDTPACVNPDHLWLGTNADNTAVKVAKGRTVGSPGDANGSRTRPDRVSHGEARPEAKLTAADVIEARAAYALSGVTHRQLAERYGVRSETIGKALRGDTWKRAGAAA